MVNIVERLTILFIVIALILIGCKEDLSNNEGSSSIETRSTAQTMPENMPKDFGFSVSFGFGKKNEINTFKDTVTKDLIEDGTKTVDIALTDEEMLEIYEKMKEIDITNTKQFIPEPVNGEMCEQEPYEEDEWKITLDGETISHYISGAYCEPTKDARQFLELRNFVFNKIENKDEYLKLPKSKGGYE